MKHYYISSLILLLILLAPAIARASPLLPVEEGSLTIFGEHAGHGYQPSDYGFVAGVGISLDGHFALGFEAFMQEYCTECGLFALLYSQPYLAKLDLFSVADGTHWLGNFSLMYVLADEEDRLALGFGVNLLFGMAHDGWLEVNLSYRLAPGLHVYGSLEYVLYTYQDPYWPYGWYEEMEFYFLKIGAAVSF